MKGISFKSYLPYLVAILAFAVISYLFTPQVFQGKVVNQSDIASWRGMANEIVSWNESHPNEEPALWTNSMFGGMPATTISVIYKGDLTDYVYKTLFVGVRPPSYLLISLVGAFLMFLAFGVNLYISFIGAIAVTFVSYNLQIIEVGHNSKMVAIAFMPWVIAAVRYTFKKTETLRRSILGALLFAVALSFQIKANHPQITYYLAIIILGLSITELWISIKDKKFVLFLRTSAILLIAGLLGIATNINHLWPTYEYSKYTMRGGSEISSTEENAKGLDIAYATQWSYSIGELPNLMIPNYNGGASAGSLSADSETYKLLKQSGYPDQEIKKIQLPFYWGPQPFTAGPMYLGAISIFLFILGLILVKGAQRWWIIGVSLVAIFLSLGSNMLFFTEFFFKYAPLYSKFRTVSMILVILQILIPLYAYYSFDKISKIEIDKKKLLNGVLIAAGITAGFSILVAILPSFAGAFESANDANLPKEIVNTLISDRMSLLSYDALRSAILILLAAAAVLGMSYKNINRKLIYIALGALVVFDLWSVGKRYLNDSHFVRENDFENQYALREVDKQILQDTTIDYRVLDLSINTFNDAHVSYHHKTIGGYSPTKMQRYQDIIDYYITPEIGQIGKDLDSVKTLEEAQSKLGTYQILNMLNTKYLVLNPNMPPLVNNNAYGNAWFVKDATIADSPKEEIERLGNLDLSQIAVLDKNFQGSVEGKFSVKSIDPKEDIKLNYYSPNKLQYEASTSKERLAIFSEIYYPAGWKAYIDGKEVEILRANYILRALVVPEGNHQIEFVYSPRSIKSGATYSSIASGILIISLISLILAGAIPKKER